MDLREQFASVIKRGQNLPVDVVVEMLFGVLRDQEPVAWAHPSGGVLQRRCTGLEQSAYTIPLFAAPVPPAESAVPDPAVAAIAYALDHPHEEPVEFLRCWMHGQFDAIRREWADVPDAVFIGADPMLAAAPKPEGK